MIVEFGVLLFLILAIGHILDYRILKNRYFSERKWDLNISCGFTDGGGINADIIEREVPNFKLIKDAYNLPFKDKQFKNVVSSHTIEHVDDPERFFNELKRVSENVTLILPPIWDLAAMLFLMEHKWQFLTVRSKHVNSLPKRVKLPYWWYHERFGQRVE
jgi:SAM-dependent methyltransferase